MLRLALARAVADKATVPIYYESRISKLSLNAAEPLLTVSDYLCWAVQRVFEQGDVRHYNYLAAKIRLLVDLYDREKYEGSRNYYDKKNPLTAGNKIGPPVT